MGHWRDHANCRGINGVMFTEGADADYRGFGSQRRTRLLTRAKNICATCPVKIPCLDYALTLGEEQYGVWGETAPEDRREMLQLRDLRVG